MRARSYILHARSSWRGWRCANPFFSRQFSLQPAWQQTRLLPGCSLRRRRRKRAKPYVGHCGTAQGAPAVVRETAVRMSPARTVNALSRVTKCAGIVFPWVACGGSRDHPAAGPSLCHIHSAGRWVGGQLQVPGVIKAVPISEPASLRGVLDGERRAAGRSAMDWQLLAECGAIRPSRRQIEVGKALRDDHGPS